jgi:radical SAM protein (TIGR01212 family)
MLNKKRYNSVTDFYKENFNRRVQKIAIDAGFTCPNRDGSKSIGGCIYCDNDTFKPFYCSPEKSVQQQLKEGIEFFSKKYKAIEFLAYFQAFTNTYASTNLLKKIYNEALAVPGIIGLVISTRPDCINEEKLNLLEELATKYFIAIEYGVESTNNQTLNLINRAHTFEEAEFSIRQTHLRNIICGAHMILGLPGEDENEILLHAEKISRLPLNSVKLHQLQIIKGTRLEMLYQQNPKKYNLYNLDEYIDLVIKFMERLNPEFIVERFSSESPKELIVAPNWGGIKNFEIVHKIEKRLEKLNTWQGRLYYP